MSKTTKKAVLKAIAVIGKKSAEIGCNPASLFSYHQPKELACLNRLQSRKMTLTCMKM